MALFTLIVFIVLPFLSNERPESLSQFLLSSWFLAALVPFVCSTVAIVLHLKKKGFGFVGLGVPSLLSLMAPVFFLFIFYNSVG